MSSPSDVGKPRVWYHTIELPDGSVTPGWFDVRPFPPTIDWPTGLEGGRCLDVGTFDGFWAFEMERRGAAEVVALDLDDPRRLDWAYDYRSRGPKMVEEWASERGPGFAEASRLLKSSVRRKNKSVYDLDPDEDGMFDVVLCGALLLHLFDPVKALEAMRSVCKGELVLVEALDPYLEIFAPRVAAARFAPEMDQWWRVNSAGLVRMAERAGFEVVWVGRRVLIPYGPGGTSAGRRHKRIHSIAARRFSGGLLHRALRARPRAPIEG